MTGDNKPNAFSALKAVAQPTIPEPPAVVQVDANVVQLAPAAAEKTTPAASPATATRVPRTKSETKSETKKFTRPGRVGMKVIAIHVDPQMARQLKILAAEVDSTIQAIAEAAIREKLAAAGKKV